MRHARLFFFLAAVLSTPAAALAQQVADGGLPEAPGGLTSPAASSPFAHVAVEQGHVVVGAGSATPRVLDTGCVARAAIGTGTELHVACEGGVVRTYAVSPDGSLSLPTDRRVGAEVRALFVLDGQVWVEYARVEAQPLASLGGGGGAVAATNVPPPHLGPLTDAGEATSTVHAETARGEVIAVHDMRATTSLGRDQGVRVGQHVEMGDDEDSLVVGVVRAATPDHSEVELGMGEHVRVGASAHVVTRPTTDHFLAPPRSAPVLSFGGTTRLLVPLGGLGIGTVNDAWVAWHASGPFALRLRMMPVGAIYFHPGTSSGSSEPDSSAGMFNGALEGMFDSDFFGLGLGVGVAQFQNNGYVCGSSPYSGYPCPSTDFGFAITQTLRIGAIDGLHLVVNNHVVVKDSSIEYGGTEGTIQIPLVHAWWLVIRGGGSSLGFGFTELGMRIATSGNGGDGTLFVTPVLGWAGVATPATYGMSLRAGPTVGVGFEYRLGV